MSIEIVLITGANGMMAKHLAKHLEEKFGICFTVKTKAVRKKK